MGRIDKCLLEVWPEQWVDSLISDIQGSRILFWAMPLTTGIACAGRGYGQKETRRAYEAPHGSWFTSSGREGRKSLLEEGVSRRTPQLVRPSVARACSSPFRAIDSDRRRSVVPLCCGAPALSSIWLFKEQLVSKLCRTTVSIQLCHVSGRNFVLPHLNGCSLSGGFLIASSWSPCGVPALGFVTVQIISPVSS
jgi:hypothetical protein